MIRKESSTNAFSWRLHLQLRIRTPDAWLVIADHAFQRERRSGEDIRATCSVDDFEVATIKADAEGSRSIQRTCTQQDLMTAPLSNSLSSRSARKQEHTCLRHRARRTVTTSYGTELGWTSLGIWTNVDLELLAGDARHVRVTKGRCRDCVARGRVSQPGSRLAHVITC